MPDVTRLDADNRVVERLVDHGDGTGTHMGFDPDIGMVVWIEELTGLPVDTPPEPSPEDRIAQLEAALAALLGGG